MFTYMHICLHTHASETLRWHSIHAAATAWTHTNMHACKAQTASTQQHVSVPLLLVAFQGVSIVACFGFDGSNSHSYATSHAGNHKDRILALPWADNDGSCLQRDVAYCLTFRSHDARYPVLGNRHTLGLHRVPRLYVHGHLPACLQSILLSVLVS
jgi:hypothetical protein